MKRARSSVSRNDFLYDRGLLSLAEDYSLNLLTGNVKQCPS